MTVPYSDEDFLLPDTIVVAKIPSIVFLVPRVGIITTMSARLFQQAFRTEPLKRDYYLRINAIRKRNGSKRKMTFTFLL